MRRDFQFAILSDIHYAGPAEQAQGDDYEYRVITNPLIRLFMRAYRRFIWLRYPLRQNGQLDRFLAEVPAADFVVANGDYSCNTAGVGLADDAAFESARECLQKLRAKFGAAFVACFGDHEIGKLRLLGTRGGMRLESWRRGVEELGISPFWKMEFGNYVFIGVASTLVALPIFEHDMLPAERPEWEKIRADHLREISAAFAALKPNQRVLLFCHDPTALAFLSQEEAVRSRLPQIEQTIIGHLHSNLFLWQSRILAGMPRIGFLGHSVKRMSTALNQARTWKPFWVKLCPSLAGIELLKDGGYLTARLDLEAREPAQFKFHPLPR